MDELYNWILFGHIIGAAIWFGGAVTYEALGAVAKRTGKASEYTEYIHSAGRANTVMLPTVALMTLGFGVWLVLQSDDVWSFSDTYISIGFATAIIGIGLIMVVMLPQGNKLHVLVEGNGFDDPDAGAIALKLGMTNHVQTLIVAIAMVAMVFKF